MKRAVAAVALIGSAAAPGALAGPGPSVFAPLAPPRVKAAPVLLAAAEDSLALALPAVASEAWTEPGGSFSFNKPVAWTDVDTASAVGAPVLEIVVSGESSECWFSRAPRPDTAGLTPRQLIAARARPMSADTWNRVAEQQHLLTSATLEQSTVEMIGVWPVQTAWFKAPDREVFAALHSRPGLDIWAFCTGKNARKRAALLRGVALSVLTPKDADWIRLLSPQASLTAVP